MQISKNYCNLRNARIILNSKLLSLNHNIAKCHPWKLVFWAWSHLLFLELLCYRVVIIVRRCPLRIKVIKINQEWWLSKPGWFRYLAYVKSSLAIFDVPNSSEHKMVNVFSIKELGLFCPNCQSRLKERHSYRHMKPPFRPFMK